MRRRWKAREVEKGVPPRQRGGLFLEERDKMEGIWVDLSIRLVSDLQKPGCPVENLNVERRALDRKV